MATQVAPETGNVTGSKKSWLEMQHPDYERHAPLVRYARLVYTGGLLDESKVTDFLIQKALGESDGAYEERQKLLDFTNYFADVVDSFTGMLSALDHDTRRIWNDKNDDSLGLGDPEDQKTPIGRLYRHADPKGRGWLSVWSLLATELAIAHRAWMLVSSHGEARDPRVSIVPFESVPNWWYDDNGILAEVLVEEQVDTRTSIRDEPGRRRQFMLYRHTSWERWQLDTQTKSERLVGNGNYQGFLGPDGNPLLPIYPVEVPMQRASGYLMARKNVVLMNKESELDSLLRACGFPIFMFCGTAAQFELAKEDRKRGINFLHLPIESPNPHQYATPESAPAEIQLKSIDAKRDAFYATAHKEYGTSVISKQQRTAAESALDYSQGAGAYLQTQKEALDDGENGAAWRVAQILFPDDRRVWFVANITRSDESQPSNPDGTADKQQERAFGKEKPVPLGFAGKLAAAQTIARLQGIPVDDEQLEAAIRLDGMTDFLGKVVDAPQPPELQAQMVGDLARSLGLANADALQKAAEEVAERNALIRERESQSFPGNSDLADNFEEDPGDLPVDDPEPDDGESDPAPSKKKGGKKGGAR